jgi:hypothetical protein
MMRAAKLNSSAIARILYDDEARTLSIWFHGSGRYVYFDVPPETFDAFCKAPSAGAFFRDCVKGRYRYISDPGRKRFRPADAA